MDLGAADGLVKWFGESWGAPICDPHDHRPTPVGETCPYCDAVIDDRAQGLLIFHLEAQGATERPWHIDCFMLTIVGRRTT